MESFFYLLATKLLALSVLVQFTEYFYLRSELKDDGIWRWSTLRGDYGPLASRLLAPAFSQRGTDVLLACGALSALGLYARPDLPFSISVFACCLLMSMRFRGTFNGGSDFMTLNVSGALAIAALFPSWARVAFVYVGIHVVLSYFLSGLVKLRNPGWRDGTTLAALLSLKKYSVPAGTAALAGNRFLMFAGSWAILIFECSFPLALLSLPVLWIYLCLALVFHAVNVHVFGLNRFFFAWLAAYPLLYYSCLQLLSGATSAP